MRRRRELGNHRTRVVNQLHTVLGELVAGGFDRRLSARKANALLDAFTAVFHRPSGATHLLVSPAPEILDLVGREALSVDDLLARLADEYALADANREALGERVTELVEAGLVQVA